MGNFTDLEVRPTLDPTGMVKKFMARTHLWIEVVEKRM